MQTGAASLITFERNSWINCGFLFSTSFKTKSGATSDPVSRDNAAIVYALRMRNMPRTQECDPPDSPLTKTPRLPVVSNANVELIRHAE